MKTYSSYSLGKFTKERFLRKLISLFCVVLMLWVSPFPVLAEEGATFS